MGLMTTSEASEYLRMNREVVRRKTKSGEIPGIRVGGRWRYRRETLDEWLTQGCPTASEMPELFPSRR